MTENVWIFFVLTKISDKMLSHLCDSMALVSSLLAFNMENLNLALTSDLLQETNNKYKDK